MRAGPGALPSPSLSRTGLWLNQTEFSVPDRGILRRLPSTPRSRHDHSRRLHAGSRLLTTRPKQHRPTTVSCDRTSTSKEAEPAQARLKPAPHHTTDLLLDVEIGDIDLWAVVGWTTDRSLRGRLRRRPSMSIPIQRHQLEHRSRGTAGTQRSPLSSLAESLRSIAVTDRSPTEGGGSRISPETASDLLKLCSGGSVLAQHIGDRCLKT